LRVRKRRMAFRMLIFRHGTLLCCHIKQVRKEKKLSELKFRNDNTKNISNITQQLLIAIAFAASSMALSSPLLKDSSESSRNWEEMFKIIPEDG